MRRAALILGFLALLAAPGTMRAGKVGGTLARYCLGGAGIGGVLGAAVAAVPYLQDKQSFDFSVGAGAGALGGAGIGLIFGIIDLATEQAAPAEAKILNSGLFAYADGQRGLIGFKTVF
jgi:hypothetical protein